MESPQEGIVPGSPVEKATELMDKIPDTMAELVSLSTERKRLQAILDLPGASTETTPTWEEVQKLYVDVSDKYEVKRKEMENIIIGLEQNGHGFVVQDAKEKLKLLD